MSQSNTPHSSIKKLFNSGELSNEAYCTSYDIHVLTSDFVGHKEDWQVQQFADSPLAHISALKGMNNENTVVIELHHPQRDFSTGCMGDLQQVVISDDDPAFYLISSSSIQEGTRLDTFNLVTAESFGDLPASICLNALHACQIAIKASLKIDAESKQVITTQIDADHHFIWSFIKQVISTPSSQYDENLPAQIDLIRESLLHNSKWYWSHIADHKASDFDFNLNK
ncbi:MAG: hypothetical protein ACPG5R_04245 [Cognaticolwellia aestuarii]